MEDLGDQREDLGDLREGLGDQREDLGDQKNDLGDQRKGPQIVKQRGWSKPNQLPAGLREKRPIFLVIYI